MKHDIATIIVFKVQGVGVMRNRMGNKTDYEMEAGAIRASKGLKELQLICHILWFENSWSSEDTLK